MSHSKEVIAYIRNYFPVTRTEEVANHLHLPVHTIRKVAKENRITKSETYLQELKTNFKSSRRKWYEDNIPEFIPKHEQEQIIFGSMLGDGYISKGAQRSIHFYYQEHFGERQRAYREWKLSKLRSLGFSINGNYLRSRSHPYITRLYKELYKDNIKTITEDFLSNCIHPLFLTTLYLDDGSLVITYRFNERKKTVYCYPSIILYTLNFTKEDNQLLASHLNKIFGTNFVVSGHPDGNGSLLKINKESEVNHFLNIIAGYATEIPSMAYKFSLSENLKIKTPYITEKYGEDIYIKPSSSNNFRNYSPEEIELIIQLKQTDCTDKEISHQLGRSYWSVVYKLSELRKANLL